MWDVLLPHTALQKGLESELEGLKDLRTFLLSSGCVSFTVAEPGCHGDGSVRGVGSLALGGDAPARNRFPYRVEERGVGRAEERDRRVKHTCELTWSTVMSQV